MKMNLQMFAEANTQTTGGLSAEMKTYYGMELLENAKPQLVHNQFAATKGLPAGGGKTVEWRKFGAFDKALKPLTEGVTPDGSGISVSYITKELAQYGDYTTVSDMLDLTAIDDVVLEITDRHGSNMGLTLDTVTRNEIQQGSQVIYAPVQGEGGSQTDVLHRYDLTDKCKLTSELVAKAATQLKKMNAPTFEGKYVCIIHPSVAFDLRQDPAWVAAHQYAAATELFSGEIGELHGVRFVETTEAKVIGPGEIVELTADGCTQLHAPGEEMRICSFLWTYYGYPTSVYEGVDVESMRYRNGRMMARHDAENGLSAESLDYVGGIPDSGTPHAIGYANESGVPFARPFIKYTPTWPRSFMPARQAERDRVAKMKQIPVHSLIQDKTLLMVDDSIVRGTQLRETVDFLYESGAKEVHMRSACPPIMYSCKYLNFSRGNSDMELLARRVVQELEGDEGHKHLDEYADATTHRGQCMLRAICEKLGFDSLGYQSLDGLLEAIGIDRDQICTYCWTGKE